MPTIDLRPGVNYEPFLAEIRAGRIRFDQDARFHYLRDGQPLDFWDVAPFDDLILAGVVRRDGDGQPLVEVTR